MIKKRPVEQRFWEKVKKLEGGCWEWQAGTVDGYGQFYPITGKSFLAHRFSYILHKCDNRICVNPDHLYPGTDQDNAKDKVERGRCNPAKGVHSARYTHPETTARGEKSGMAKLTLQKVREIRSRYIPRKCGVGALLAAEYKVSLSTIKDIVRNRTWREELYGFKET